jgi:hypothetical protein
MSFRIQDIKSALKFGGARPSLFNVTMQLPSAVQVDGNFAPGISKGDFNSKFSFLCRAASLPQSTVASINVPYMGAKMKVAGNRTYEDWSVTVINDEDFAIRKGFEMWLHAINHQSDNIRNNGATSQPASYKTDALVSQFAKDNDVDPIRKIKFYGLFPTQISAIELDWDSTDTIETFTVTFAYDYHLPDNSSN